MSILSLQEKQKEKKKNALIKTRVYTSLKKEARVLFNHFCFSNAHTWSLLQTKTAL